MAPFRELSGYEFPHDAPSKLSGVDLAGDGLIKVRDLTLPDQGLVAMQAMLTSRHSGRYRDIRPNDACGVLYNGNKLRFAVADGVSRDYYKRTFPESGTLARDVVEMAMQPEPNEWDAIHEMQPHDGLTTLIEGDFEMVDGQGVLNTKHYGGVNSGVIFHLDSEGRVDRSQPARFADNDGDTIEAGGFPEVQTHQEYVEANQGLLVVTDGAYINLSWKDETIEEHAQRVAEYSSPGWGYEVITISSFDGSRTLDVAVRPEFLNTNYRNSAEVNTLLKACRDDALLEDDFSLTAMFAVPRNT
jgi:hypothetical protein